MDLAGDKDFKGHDLAASAYQESRTSGHGFAIFHWPAANKENTAGKEKSEQRYAYFAYFQPWDWVFAVSGDAREVVTQFDARRKEMEHPISEALTSMRLAQRSEEPTSELQPLMRH